MKNREFYTQNHTEKRPRRAQIVVSEKDDEYLQEIDHEYATLEEVSRKYKLSRSQTYKTLRACQRFTIIIISGKHKMMQYTAVRWRDVNAVMAMRGNKGNQLFHSSAFQQEMALRRWYPVDSDRKPNTDIRLRED